MTTGPVTWNESLKISLVLFSKVTGSTPQLNVTYRVVPNPVAINTNVAIPLVDTSGLIVPSASVLANNIIKLDISPSITSVPVDSLVFFEISRTSGDAYIGDICVLDTLCSYS
jgi:hypothetical protein